MKVKIRQDKLPIYNSMFLISDKSVRIRSKLARYKFKRKFQIQFSFVIKF